MDIKRPEPKFYTFDSIFVGQKEEFFHKVTEKDIDLFTELTADYHPIHHDDEYAEKSNFGSRITQGLLTASFISRLIGMHMPGRQALYLSQDMKFVRPVHIGDTIRIIGTVTEKTSEKRNTIILKTEIFNQNDTLVLTGNAKIWVRGQNE